MFQCSPHTYSVSDQTKCVSLNKNLVWKVITILATTWLFVRVAVQTTVSPKAAWKPFRVYLCVYIYSLWLYRGCNMSHVSVFRWLMTDTTVDILFCMHSSHAVAGPRFDKCGKRGSGWAVCYLICVLSKPLAVLSREWQAQLCVW